ncbi:MAG: hypothetical protein U5M23_14215 [Marinagarivorans sp.]|nr:hypothetical protein [Marinagarivorans sp.]
MKFCKLILVFLLWLPACSYSLSIQPSIVKVQKSNAINYSVNVLIEQDEFFCAGSDNVYISFPKIFEGSRFKGVNVSLMDGDNILLDVSSIAVEQKKFAQMDTFHGSLICADKSLLHSLRITVAYGRGELVTHMISIVSLDEWNKTAGQAPIKGKTLKTK